MAATNVVKSIGRYRQTILACLASWCSLYNTNNSFDDVINIGEITLTITVIEDLDGLASKKFNCKNKVGHIRSTSRAINSKETKTCRGNVI